MDAYLQCAEKSPTRIQYETKTAFKNERTIKKRDFFKGAKSEFFTGKSLKENSEVCIQVRSDPFQGNGMRCKKE